MRLDRRGLLAMTASACAAHTFVREAAATGETARVQAAVERFGRLSPTTSCLVASEHAAAPWRVAHNAGARLFVGSAVKTFILRSTCARSKPDA